MRIKFLALASSLFLMSNCLAGSPQSTSPTTSSPQAATLLVQSAKALIGSTSINDATLIGTVRRIVGPDDETGTVTYKALNTASALVMEFSSGNRSEIRSSVGGVSTGQWSGPDGVIHPIADQNLLIDPAWFPTFLLSNFSGSYSATLTYDGMETIDSAAAIHITASQQFPDIPGENAALLQRLSQIEIYLNPSTLLPIAIRFNSHPDDNAVDNLSTEFEFSDYRNIGGTQIPFHVQKSLNDSLTLDLQFQTATLNTGLTPAQLAAQ